MTNGYIESDEKVQSRWESRKRRDDAILTARANHAACMLAETMRDCDNCKFQPDESGLPFLALSDTVAIAVTPTIKAAWQIEAEAQAKEDADYQNTISGTLEKPVFGSAKWFDEIEEVKF